MRLMGAEVRPVHYGTATLKDATSEAIRDWVTNVETTHYILGSAAGPHPYPMMVIMRIQKHISQDLDFALSSLRLRSKNPYPKMVIKN